MPEQTKHPYFIFPLTNVNLFPKTTKPLHIFEPRYVQMVEESIAKQIPIAVCFVPEGSKEIRPVAGYGLPKIIESRDDQTMLIFMTGLGKVRLDIDRIQITNFLQMADGEMIQEEVLLEESFKPKYRALSEALVRWIRGHISDQQQQEIFIRGLTGPREVVGAFAAYLIFDYDLQYEMMEIISINEQIKFLYRLLESGKLAST
ncbi:MAG: LON peptidase substrate-binding domain-containing protein [Bdellovibrio sp.]|nr:LON peptidase substrate-binding domain-containing protein [Bdellovibrio sp.]